MNQHVEEASEPKYTAWHNPTLQTQVVTLLVPGGQNKLGMTLNKQIAYVFKPGERKQIPSEFDHSIHILGPDKRTILGGIAPLLVKVGSEEVLSEGCDVGLQAQKEAEKIAAAAALQSAAAGMSFRKAAQAFEALAPAMEPHPEAAAAVPAKRGPGRPSSSEK